MNFKQYFRKPWSAIKRGFKIGEPERPYDPDEEYQDRMQAEYAANRKVKPARHREEVILDCPMCNRKTWHEQLTYQERKTTICRSCGRTQEEE